jgi:hypothetical protein
MRGSQIRMLLHVSNLKHPLYFLNGLYIGLYERLAISNATNVLLRA